MRNLNRVMREIESGGDVRILPNDAGRDAVAIKGRWIPIQTTVELTAYELLLVSVALNSRGSIVQQSEGRSELSAR